MRIAFSFELWHLVLALPVILWAVITLWILVRSGWRMALIWPILLLMGGVNIQ